MRKRTKGRGMSERKKLAQRFSGGRQLFCCPYCKEQVTTIEDPKATETWKDHITACEQTHHLVRR